MRAKRGVVCLLLGGLVAVALFQVSPLHGLRAPVQAAQRRADLEVSTLGPIRPSAATITASSFERLWSAAGRSPFAPLVGDLAQSGPVRTALVVAMLITAVARRRPAEGLSRASFPRAPPVRLQP